MILINDRLNSNLALFEQKRSDLSKEPQKVKKLKYRYNLSGGMK